MKMTRSGLVLTAESEAEQERLGGLLASCCPSGCTIYLQGDLGAGKTTLVRGFLRALGHQGAVKSPTYTLIEPYTIAGRSVCHLDLYRLADPEELEYLGLRDLLREDTVMLIEWPERGHGMLPDADLRVNIAYLGAGRQLEMVPGSRKGEQTIHQMINQLHQIVNE